MLKTDIEILDDIYNGNTRAFAELVKKYKDPAFALCVKFFKNENDAEDVLQESFIRFYNAIKLKKFEAKSKLSTYFYSIVYNTSVEYYRKKKSKPLNIYSIDVTESSFKDGDELRRNMHQIEYETVSSKNSGLMTEKIVSESEIQHIVSEYVNSIPEQYSIILTMFYMNELTLEEISHILKLPMGTVKNRIFRAKEKLREVLLKVFSKEEIIEYI